MLIKVGHCSPNLTDNVNIERDEDHQRDDENDDGNPTKVHLMQEGWPASEVTDTLWLQGAIQLGLSQLYCEDGDGREGGEQGYEPGSSHKVVGRPGD